jgi:hypothetical protein
MRADISEGEELLLLVDTGADISILKPDRLDKTKQFDPERKMKVKGVSGSSIQTLGAVQVTMYEGTVEIPFTFQLVGRQVDIPCDGILGRDFLTCAGANICYEKGTLTLGSGNNKIHKVLTSVETWEKTKGDRKLELPGRTEMVVSLPVEGITGNDEGVTERRVLQDGVYLAGAITKVRAGFAITSIVNTNENKVEIETPVLRVAEVEPGPPTEPLGEGGKVESSIRSSEVLNRLRLGHLNEEERRNIEKTCLDYQDIFHLPGETLSSTQVVKHEIRLEPGTEPVNIRPYRLPESQKPEVRRQVEELKRGGIIIESSSPWNSPLLIVRKKEDTTGEKQWRLVIDYRKLNEKTVGDAYPLPDVTEILDQLGQSKYFSCIDMVMGYHQIEMASEDRAKTAFSTKEGHWEYQRLPFGLKTAPATFQRMMNVVLSGLTGTRCFVFLDDIVIYAKSLAEHDAKIRQVFDRLRGSNLKLKPEKCEFLREVSYLGHIISENGVLPDKAKTKVIEEFPTPQNTKQLKSFLGLMSYYRRFIPRFSTIASPLHKLLKKDVTYEWTEAQEHAFRSLQSRLVSPPILRYPDYTRKFILTTDASNEGVGAVLSQGEIGKDFPIAFASRSLNKAEKNYSTTEKELLAIVWGVRYFRPYLYGTKFTIVTDHKPLTWIVSVKDPGSRLLRWRLKLEEYDYEIVYKRGVANTNADALSRVSQLAVVTGETDAKRQLVTDEETKNTILYEYHDSPVGGHRGMNRTVREIRKRYSWPNMKREIEGYVKKCQVNKTLGPRKRAPMEITTTARRPFERCAIDIVGPTTETVKGNRYILTFQDDLTKFVVAEPIQAQDADTVAREFVRSIVLKFGAPEVALSDHGSNFLSELFRNTCKLLRIKKINTTAFHPESNGGLERGHSPGGVPPPLRSRGPEGLG